MNKVRLVKLSLVGVAIVTLLVTEFAIYNYATNLGYNNAVTSLAEALRQVGATVDITDSGNGRYELHVHFPTAGGQAGTLSVLPELHMTVEQWRDGGLISSTYHAMTLTSAGKDWLEGVIGNAVGADVARYIGCSNSSDAFDAAWTTIPDEITGCGLGRAGGAYLSTGVGTWNCSYTFSVSATNSTKLYGLYYAAAGVGLLAAEQQGVGSQKNLLSGDTLKITVQGTIS